ncbi:hypothetical protein MANES_02G051900v8 [Manihot esculenta]|uniref:Uncharacterized protein n=1 Tax=Manihot esculenta TaxID=3983 RepID=A0ACB7I5R7_MANES|nr:hypothetical protein MANES_02G051900v8 [Manihot esculenta]
MAKLPAPTIKLSFFLTDIYEQYVLLSDFDDPIVVSEETFLIDERCIEVAACDYEESICELLCETLTAMGVSEDNHERIGRQVDFEVQHRLETSRGTDTATIVIPTRISRTFSEEYEDGDAGLRQPIPASKSSIDGLARIVFHVGVQDPGICTVCLKEFEDGDDLIQMPCSHLYHQHCIVEWLMSSHLCPLCRYQMPTTQLCEDLPQLLVPGSELN